MSNLLSWYSWTKPVDEPYTFGAPNKGRSQYSMKDDGNNYMFKKELSKYLLWHLKSQMKFYPGAKREYRLSKFWQYAKYATSALFGAFTLFVVNPNYTMSRSYYLRRIFLLASMYIGYTFGLRYEMLYKTLFMQKMVPYFPMEIRRGLETNDYRYLYLFNTTKKNRKLFDEQTGMSLS